MGRDDMQPNRRCQPYRFVETRFGIARVVTRAGFRSNMNDKSGARVIAPAVFLLAPSVICQTVSISAAAPLS